MCSSGNEQGGRNGSTRSAFNMVCLCRLIHSRPKAALGFAAAELPAAAHQVESQRRRRHAPQTDGVRGHADVNHRTLATYLNACVENGLTLVPFVFQRPSQA
jgi:hypothetical protein